jgi:hypothetical protein
MVILILLIVIRSLSKSWNVPEKRDSMFCAIILFPRLWKHCIVGSEGFAVYTHWHCVCKHLRYAWIYYFCCVEVACINTFCINTLTLLQGLSRIPNFPNIEAMSFINLKSLIITRFTAIAIPPHV